MKICCALGKYLYGNSSRGISTEYAGFVSALKHLGHEVIHFELWDRNFYTDYAQLNRELLAVVSKEKPDVLLAVPLNYEIWLETLLLIQQREDVATICWTTDDSWKYREVSRFIGRGFHAMTTTYPEVLPLYQKDGIPYVLLTQWAAGSDTMAPPLPASACSYQVSFVGTAHGNRKQRVLNLERAGIPVTCFGYGWPSGPVNDQDIPQIVNESVISLNFSNSKGRNQIKARTFEVPAAGGFLLTETAPRLEKYYRLGEEIDVFNNQQELIEKIRFYLSHNEKRDTMACAGYERTRKDHTYEVRMKTVLDFVMKAKENHFKKPKASIAGSLNTACQRHRLSPELNFLRQMIVYPAVLIWGQKRGMRAARRLIFEMSWRFFKEKTFTASGWPGRMFPKQ